MFQKHTFTVISIYTKTISNTLLNYEHTVQSNKTGPIFIRYFYIRKVGKYILCNKLNGGNNRVRGTSVNYALSGT